jgi:Leucine-rich repeat (LRR) protein
MNFCYQKSITDNAFSYLLNIKELKLQGCCSGWNSNHQFTDKMFDYLSNLEKFYIDDNHVITDNGIQKLKNIKELTLRNCINITNNGLSNLITLNKLDIYNLNKLTDDVFRNLINLQELDMTFCNITDKGILYLSNIRKLVFLSCEGITCKDYDKLLKLESINIINLVDDNYLYYLRNIKCIILHQCDINGYGLQYLLNVEQLIIYRCPIIDEYINHLKKLKNIKYIRLINCYLISELKKDELEEFFGNKFKSE